MPRIGDVVPYFSSTGAEKAAVITEIEPNGLLGLCVLATNTRHVPARTWKEPGAAMVVPDLGGEAAVAAEFAPPVAEIRVARAMNAGDMAGLDSEGLPNAKTTS